MPKKVLPGTEELVNVSPSQFGSAIYPDKRSKILLQLPELRERSLVNCIETSKREANKD